MSGLSRYTNKKLLEHLFKVSTFTPPEHFYVALYTIAPTSIGGGTEVSGGAYTRMLCDTWSSATEADPSIISNSVEFLFPQATEAWGSIAAVGILDASTGGNLLGFGLVNKVIGIGDQVKFITGDLKIQLQSNS